jgi:hypothetical protein
MVDARHRSDPSSIGFVRDSSAFAMSDVAHVILEVMNG